MNPKGTAYGLRALSPSKQAGSIENDVIAENHRKSGTVQSALSLKRNTNFNGSTNVPNTSVNAGNQRSKSIACHAKIEGASEKDTKAVKNMEKCSGAEKDGCNDNSPESSQTSNDRVNYFTFQSILLWPKWISESTRIQIYIFTLIHLMVLATIILILQYGIGMLVESIMFYNLLHAVSGLLGKFSLAAGLRVVWLISKDYSCRDMIRHSNGVSLTSIAHPLPIIKLNPKEGRTLRYLFIASLIMIEATVWFLGIQLEWEPSFSTIGKYPCTKVQFTQEPNISSRLGDYLQGDSTFASLNTYGLALDDGLVGGMTGRPIAELYNSFRMTQDSVAFAVNTVCGQLEVIGPDGNNQTRFAMKSSQLWSTMFSAEISVHFPAGSHDWEQFAGSDVLELCTIRYTMGHANITSSFVTDKWGGLAMDSIQSITFGKLQVDRASSSGVFYGQIQNEFGSNNGYANLTSWTADAIRSVFNASYPPSQGELFCDLFEFATLPDGLYHISETWKGVTAIVAMIAHYILSHNEDSTSDVLECSYEGLQGAGVILCPDYVKVATTVSVTLCFVIEIAQLLWWFLLSGGNGKNDRVACLLDSPMMFLYYVKDTGGKLFKDCLPDMKHKGIQEFADGVHVRFGELRFTRANDTGTLVLAPPEDIIGMVAERNYFGLK